MGLYDRDYVRTEAGGNWFTGQSAVVQLLLINAAVFLVDVLLFEGRLVQWLALRTDLVWQPWHAYQLLTYGFLHSTASFGHVLFNMYALWLFGTDVEGRFGRAEFWRIYLAAVVFSGAIWLLLRVWLFPGMPSAAVGASGAVTCVMVMFVLLFPHRIILLFFIIPVPAWLMGALYVAIDMVGFAGSVRGQGPPVAFEAHLAGALLGFLYIYFRWNLGRLVPNLSGWKRRLRGTRLRVHREGPASADPPAVDAETALNERVDRILEKISQHGSDSLTAQERRILEEASRRYQQRRE